MVRSEQYSSGISFGQSFFPLRMWTTTLTHIPMMIWITASLPPLTIANLPEARSADASFPLSPTPRPLPRVKAPTKDLSLARRRPKRTWRRGENTLNLRRNQRLPVIHQYCRKGDIFFVRESSSAQITDSKNQSNSGRIHAVSTLRLLHVRCSLPP